MRVHQRKRLFQAVGARDAEHLRHAIHKPAFAVGVLLAAQAAGHDHASVFPQSFRDGFQAFGHRRVNKGAGVDDHQIGLFVIGGDDVAFGAKFRNDALGVHQRLRATQANKANAADSSFLHSCHCCSLLFDPDDCSVSSGLFAVAAIAVEAFGIGKG